MSCANRHFPELHGHTEFAAAYATYEPYEKPTLETLPYLLDWYTAIPKIWIRELGITEGLYGLKWVQSILFDNCVVLTHLAQEREPYDWGAGAL